MLTDGVNTERVCTFILIKDGGQILCRPDWGDSLEHMKSVVTLKSLSWDKSRSHIENLTPLIQKAVSVPWIGFQKNHIAYHIYVGLLKMYLTNSFVQVNAWT